MNPSSIPDLLASLGCLALIFKAYDVGINKAIKAQEQKAQRQSQK